MEPANKAPTKLINLEGTQHYACRYQSELADILSRPDVNEEFAQSKVRGVDPICYNCRKLSNALLMYLR